MQRYYFDYAATTPVDSRVVKAMLPYQSEIFGNPGSLHKFGQEASAAVFKARNKIAKLINCDYREVIFTGSATEANNLAIRGIIKAAFLFPAGTGVVRFQRADAPAASRSDGRTEPIGAPRSAAWKQRNLPRIITSEIEHESVLETCRDLERDGLAEIVYLPVSKTGIVDLKKLKESLNERTVLVSIMYANNEIGSIQPIKEISKIIREFKIKNCKLKIYEKFPIFHSDAAQAFNYLNCDIKELGVDLMTLSSQKIYGPKGIGLLYVNNFGSFRGEKFIKAIITGGHQEEGLRAGTENVAEIVGFAEAAQIAFDIRQRESARLMKLQNYFWKKLKLINKHNGVLLNGPVLGRERLPNNINIYLRTQRLGEGVYFPGQKGLIYKLDMAGFAVSSGSACSARLAKPSHVLKALGFSDEKASESLRISFGRQTDKSSVDKLLKILKNMTGCAPIL